MKRLFCCLCICALVILSAPFSIYAQGSTLAYSSFNITSPDYTNRSSVVVYINVNNKEIKIKELQAKFESQGWETITNSNRVTITRNGMLHVKALYEDDTEEEISDYIECFDKTKPTITLTETSKNKLLISAKDDLSGIKYLYINDETFTYDDFDTSNDDNTAITFRYTVKSSTNLIIQAEDYAGNLSRELTHGNNNYNSSGSNNYSGADTADTKNGTIGNARIEIITPEWTNKKTAYVKVNVSGNNIQSISAKTDRKGEFYSIKSTMDVKITQNTDVYIKVVESDGKETITSTYIECFDNQKPYVSINQNGSKITISCEDSQSGIQTLYVDGAPMSVTSYIVEATEHTKYVYAQAKDNAGNMSDVQTYTVNHNFLKKNQNSTGAETTTYNSDDEVVSNDNPADQKIYNISVGDKDYTIEDLKKAGIPVYIFTDLSDQQLEDIVRQIDTLYRTNAENQLSDETKTEDSQLEDEEAIPAMLSVNGEDMADLEEPEAPPKKPSSNNGFFISLIVALIIFAVVSWFFISRKARKNKKNDGDLYENMDEEAMFEKAFDDQDLEE